MKMKKLLAALLAVCMLLTMLPVAAFAEDTITVYFRNKHKITFNDQEVVFYHYYSDGSGMVSADKIHVQISDNGVNPQFFEMTPVSDEKEFWKAEIPATYSEIYDENSNIIMQFGDLEKGLWTAGCTVPTVSGLMLDVNSEDYSLGYEDNCWVKFDDSIKSLGSVTGFPDHPEHHVIVSTTEKWEDVEFTYYHCQYCSHVVSSPNVENVLTLEEDEKYLLKNINDKNLLIGVMPGAEIVAGSDFTVGLVVNGGTISDSTVNADIINMAIRSESVVRQFPTLKNIDCGGRNVFNQWYLKEDMSDSEQLGVVTWPDAMESSLTMKYYFFSQGGEASLEDSVVVENNMMMPLSDFLGLEDDSLDTDRLPGEEDVDSKTWSWPSKEWMENVQEMTPPQMLSDESEEDSNNWQPMPLFNGFTVPSGYTLSVDKMDFTLTKETPKVETPVVEDTNDNDDWYEEETESLVVRIKFDGVDEDDFDGIKVNLLKNGKEYDYEELSASKVSKKDWRYEWDNLDEDEDWSVELADKIEGYEAEVVNLRGNYWTITLSAKDVVAEKANPETGAADFVGAAVVMAVVSAAAGALALKK